MSDARRQPAHGGELLGPSQARLELRLAGLLFSHALLGIGDAVEHLVQRPAKDGNFLRAAARGTVLALACGHPCHALRQFVQMPSDG